MVWTSSKVRNSPEKQETGTVSSVTRVGLSGAVFEMETTALVVEQLGFSTSADFLLISTFHLHRLDTTPT